MCSEYLQKIYVYIFESATNVTAIEYDPIKQTSRSLSTFSEFTWGTNLRMFVKSPESCYFIACGAGDLKIYERNEEEKLSLLNTCPLVRIFGDSFSSGRFTVFRNNKIYWWIHDYGLKDLPDYGLPGLQGIVQKPFLCSYDISTGISEKTELEKIKLN